MRVSIRGIILAAALVLALWVGLSEGGIAGPLSLLGYALLVAAAWLVYGRKSLGLTSEGWAGSILWGLACGVAAAIVALPVYLYFAQTSAHFSEFPHMLAKRTGVTSIGVLLPLLALGYGVGSLLHELFYRGLLQTGLEGRAGAAGAILIAALLFGWAHWPEGIYSAVIGLYEGLICGMLFHRWRNILAPWFFRMGHITVILTVLFTLKGVEL
jgi:membrane protease YdiL (CAAX protease family)